MMNMLLVTKQIPVNEEEYDLFYNYTKHQIVDVKTANGEFEYDVLKEYYIPFFIRNVKSVSYHNLSYSDSHHMEIVFGENGENSINMLPDNVMTIEVSNDLHCYYDNAIVL